MIILVTYFQNWSFLQYSHLGKGDYYFFQIDEPRSQNQNFQFLSASRIRKHKKASVRTAVPT